MKKACFLIIAILLCVCGPVIEAGEGAVTFNGTLEMQVRLDKETGLYCSECWRADDKGRFLVTKTCRPMEDWKEIERTENRWPSCKE
jgi:hypothetical protein